MKKYVAFIACFLVMSMAALAAAASTADVRSITKSQKKVEIEYPFMIKGTASVNEKINAAIGSAVLKLTEEADKAGGGKIAYVIRKSDAALISMSLVMTPKQGQEYSKCLTFDRNNGNVRPLSYYYQNAEVLRRSADALKYLYDVPAAKGRTVPDEYYVDEDKNIIGLYHAGTLLAKSEGEIEINLSAADPLEIIANMDAEEQETITPPPVYSGPGPKGKITGTDVRMRSAVGLGSEVLDYFELNEVVKVIKSATAGGRKWINVGRANGTEGWVAAEYCETSADVPAENTETAAKEEAAAPAAEQKTVAVAEKTGQITGTDVRMRSEANLQAEILGYFDNGEKVTILGTASGSGREWTHVRRGNGSEGWVASEYCTEL